MSLPPLIKQFILVKRFILGSLLAGLIAAPSLAAAPQIIELTQTGCQFLESEKDVDHQFRTKSTQDCLTINKETGPDRLAKAKTLHLKPGTYIFRVHNRDVPYELGFWLREKDYDWKNPMHMATKTSVSGSGLEIGDRKDYEVTLKAGEFIYSCPLNPTPDYRLVVEK